MSSYSICFENNTFCELTYVKEGAIPLEVINSQNISVIENNKVSEEWIQTGQPPRQENGFYSIDDVKLGDELYILTPSENVLNKNNKKINFAIRSQAEYRPLVMYGLCTVDLEEISLSYIGEWCRYRVGLIANVENFEKESNESSYGWGNLKNVRMFGYRYRHLYKFDVMNVDGTDITASNKYALSENFLGNSPILKTTSARGEHEITNIKYIGEGIFITHFRQFATYSVDINEEIRLRYKYSGGFLENDPLSGGGISGVGGTGSGGTGGGNWSAPSDNINFPITPTVPDIMKTGLFSAYAMTTAELQTFGDYLWNGDFFDIIQKIASDPLDSIIGLSVFPFDLSTVASESVPLKVGNATVNNLETVSKLQTNMKTISCGSINISHYSGNAMDYAPYTKLQIYLPYIGIRDLNINDFMNSIIKVDYAIDILTGSCCAYISTVNDGVNKVLYTFTGKMSADIPISGRNYATLVGAISTLATTGALATTLGGALPIAGAALLSASKMVANSQPQVEHSGNFNSHLSMNLLQTPYLIITRPRQSLPQYFNSFKGYPSNITERLGNLSGYTEVEYVHMDDFPNATKDEILEIETLLKSGVIL